MLQLVAAHLASIADVDADAGACADADDDGVLVVDKLEVVQPILNDPEIGYPIHDEGDRLDQFYLTGREILRRMDEEPLSMLS